MGWQGAGWLERPEREREEAASKLLPSLEIKAGQAVADFGAGSGFHTVRLAKLVGEKGKVYAVDIQKEMIELIRKRAKQDKLENIELVLSKEKEPKLPAASVDMILMVDVYHELTYPYEVTIELIKALKPGGRLVFVEYRLEDPKGAHPRRSPHVARPGQKGDGRPQGDEASKDARPSPLAARRHLREDRDEERR